MGRLGTTIPIANQQLKLPELANPVFPLGHRRRSRSTQPHNQHNAALCRLRDHHRRSLQPEPRAKLHPAAHQRRPPSLGARVPARERVHGRRDDDQHADEHAV